jgi:hypothetical protein
MECVVILGAGASLAEAIYHRPVQTKEHPPLDTNFFEKLETHGHRSQLEPVFETARLRNPFENKTRME